MINIKNSSDCCGCTACASICMHDAITMTPDALGFLYPKVDRSKCVDCGLCEKVCSFNANYDKTLNLPKPDIWGARHKDMNEVETSRSGAAFVAISDWILSNGGVVYGVGYTDHFRVVHKRATSKEERDEFKGSKYVQSDLTGIFRHVKQDLKNGKIVLFSGTPCQTSGLNSYVGKRLRDNLYLVDLVCHGTPGPYIWRDYIKYLEEKQGSEIVSVNFRNKQLFGWKDHRESFVFKNGSKIQASSFTKIFYKNIMLRHSCYKCHYTNIIRPSDITLADFWQKKETICNMNEDDKGLSLLFINTEKGRELFRIAQQDLNTQEIEFEEYVGKCMQMNLRHPSRAHPKRMQFEKEYGENGFAYVISKDYDKKSLLRRLIKRIVSFAK